MGHDRLHRGRRGLGGENPPYGDRHRLVVRRTKLAGPQPHAVPELPLPRFCHQQSRRRYLARRRPSPPRRRGAGDRGALKASSGFATARPGTSWIAPGLCWRLFPHNLLRWAGPRAAHLWPARRQNISPGSLACPAGSSHDAVHDGASSTSRRTGPGLNSGGPASGASCVGT